MRKTSPDYRRASFDGAGKKEATRAFRSAGDARRVEVAAQAIWDGLPKQFRAVLGNVTVHVADFADAETLKALHIHNRYDLLGLYHGVGLPSKSVWDPVSLPDRVFPLPHRYPQLRLPDRRAGELRYPPRADPRDRSPFRIFLRRHGPDRIRLVSTAAMARRDAPYLKLSSPETARGWRRQGLRALLRHCDRRRKPAFPAAAATTCQALRRRPDRSRVHRRVP